jgi:hypothetical protein
VEQVDGGVPSLSLGPAVKHEGQGSRGRRRHYGVKRASLPPPQYLYHRTGVVGIVVVFHYPDRFSGRSPCGGMEWGGGSCNRATRQ